MRNCEDNEKKFNIQNQISFDDIRYIDKINYTNDELTLSKTKKSNKVKNNTNFKEDYGISLN